ncbi:hypothetical protein KJZ61_02325 [Candidatus Dependentiae bacterium]|nr:hypothetical protein [Candidatus Dependentiae bacterium]
MVKLFLIMLTICLHSVVVFAVPERIGSFMVDRESMALVKSVCGYSMKLYITPDEHDAKRAIAKLYCIKIKEMNEQKLEIRKLWVNPAYRENGCATCLIERVKNQEALLAGAREIQLLVGAFEKDSILSLEECLKRDKELLRFYQKRGFVSSKENKWHMTYRIPNSQ